VIDVARVLSVTAVPVVVTRLALPGQVDAVGTR
jgi:hypothetical protein